MLRTDVERLTAWYYDHGYVTVRVDEPQVERRDDGLDVTIKIDEGEQFKIGKVEIDGKDLPDRRRRSCRRRLATKPGEIFSASALRDDVAEADRAPVRGRLRVRHRRARTPRSIADDEDGRRHLPGRARQPGDGRPHRGRPGNTKTRDKVIRREMRLQEQELFSGTKLRKSREALQRLGFFQEVNVTTRKRAGADDRMDVVVDVKEGADRRVQRRRGLQLGGQPAVQRPHPGEQPLRPRPAPGR